MKKFLTRKRKAILKSYFRHVLGAGICAALYIFADLAPQYAVLIAAVAGPLVKWADVAEKDFKRR